MQAGPWVRAKRALLAELHGDCSVPVGAWGRIEDGLLYSSASVTLLNGADQVTAAGNGSIGDPKTLGKRVASDLICSRGPRLLREDTRIIRTVAGSGEMQY